MQHPARVRAVLFDAVGTLMAPHPPVAEAYRAAGQRFGVQLSTWEIARRFRSAVAQQERARDPLRRTNSVSERKRWQGIVSAVFEELAPAAAEELLAVLWAHFAVPDHWRLLPGAAQVWQELSQRKLHLGLASNFDERLRPICANMPPLNACPNLFVSTEVGYAKPSSVFYQMVQNHLGLAGDQILLVGDDFVNDYQGARNAGWQALLFDPKGQAETGTPTLARLADLPALFA